PVTPFDRTGRASRRASRFATAEVALRRLIGLRQREDGAERASDRAEMTADTDVAEHDLGTGSRVNGDGVDGAGVHAPRLVALDAGERCVARLLVEHVDADDGTRRLEGAGLHPGTGQFALHAAGTLVGNNFEAFRHQGVPSLSRSPERCGDFGRCFWGRKKMYRNGRRVATGTISSISGH